jgi:hypothetical protein
MNNIVLAAIALVVGLAVLLFIMAFATRKKKTPASSAQASVNKQAGQIDPTLDSDRDRIPDVEEINKYGSNPHSYDTDRDGIGDRQEILQRTDPTSADTDRDRLTDLQESYMGTDPTHPDTDRDGIPDSQDKD